MADQQLTQEMEAKFLAVLEDLLECSQVLSPFCLTVEEMQGVVELALTNPAQLRLLHSQITSKNDPPPSGTRSPSRLPK